VQYRPVGIGGPRVSAIAYGNWLTHGGYADSSASAECVAAALEVGITAFDTADVYSDGRAEEILGKALSAVRRDSVVVSTKVGLCPGPPGHDKDLSRRHVLTSCQRSLRRLRTDYIDLYQAHRFDHETPLEETIGALAELVRRGDVRHVGVSEWTVDQLRAGQAIADDLGIGLVSNQAQYSMLWRVIEPAVVPASIELGIAQVAFSPLAQGVLTGKYLPRTPWPERSRAVTVGTSSITRCLSDEVLERVQRLRAIAESIGVTLAQLGVAWVLHRPGVAAAVVGASSSSQLRETAAAAEVVLDLDVMRKIDEALGDVVDRDPAKAGKTYDVMARWRV
jgi:aryl-alcohol dehydrogenase-like predicted oxidoreductase